MNVGKRDFGEVALGLGEPGVSGSDQIGIEGDRE